MTATEYPYKDKVAIVAGELVRLEYRINAGTGRRWVSIELPNSPYYAGASVLYTGAPDAPPDVTLRMGRAPLPWYEKVLGVLQGAIDHVLAERIHVVEDPPALPEDPAALAALAHKWGVPVKKITDRHAALTRGVSLYRQFTGAPREVAQ